MRMPTQLIPEAGHVPQPVFSLIEPREILYNYSALQAPDRARPSDIMLLKEEANGSELRIAVLQSNIFCARLCACVLCFCFDFFMDFVYFRQYLTCSPSWSKSHSVDQVVLEHTELCLPLLQEHWDSRRVLP